jgi:hypothetical protein
MSKKTKNKKQLSKVLNAVTTLYTSKKNKEKKRLLKTFILEKVGDIKEFNKSLKQKVVEDTPPATDIKKEEATITSSNGVPALQPSSNLIESLKEQKIAETE